MLIFLILNSLHTSVIRWDRRLAPLSDSNASGTSNTGTVPFTNSSVTSDQKSEIPLAIASFSGEKFHNVDSDNLKRSLHWNRMQWWEPVKR